MTPSSLTGPDREVDGLLWCMFTPNRRFIKMAEQGDTWGEWEGDGRKNTLLPGAMLFERTDYKGTQEDIQRHGGRFQQFSSSPAYTASLDAALALVEEVRPEWGWGLTTRAYDNGKWQGPDGTTPHYRADLFSPILTPAYATAFAATAPVALLAALLKSLIHAE